LANRNVTSSVIPHSQEWGEKVAKAGFKAYVCNLVAIR